LKKYRLRKKDDTTRLQKWMPCCARIEAEEEKKKKEEESDDREIRKNFRSSTFWESKRGENNGNYAAILKKESLGRVKVELCWTSQDRKKRKEDQR